MTSKKEEKTTEKALQVAVGRRKRAIARVRMFAGKGEILINGTAVEKLVASKAQLIQFMTPITQVGMNEDHYFTAKVLGGGSTGQLEAVKLAIARCISKVNDDMKKTMRDSGFLTRDPREKERKKVYHVRARKSPQFSKR